ncbi:uncharacterized protein [Rutidosis leptorrhynchoides]|uniref:uncharacterized protein n=1 Tax=Rutidosis leptorrhynchoides TaxID=125765 RepID=UPI003A99BD34
MCDGVRPANFREASLLGGYLADDNSQYICLQEEYVFNMPYELRRLLATIRIYSCPNNPQELWLSFENHFVADFITCHQMTRSSNESGTFFVNGPGGTGKIYVYRALLAKVRSGVHIVLATATSGLAASILPGGRTAHSRFIIPLDLHEGTVCRDLIDNNALFGGKVVVLGGDFRQTLQVVPKGSKSETLATPQTDNSLNALVDYIYPNIHLESTTTPSNLNRAILTTKNTFADDINNISIEIFPGEERDYNSFDETTDPNDQSQYEDLLHSLTPNGMPPHKLMLKVNSPIIMLINLNPTERLCNGIRLICKQLERNVINAEITFGDFAGKQVFIHRIPLQPSTDERVTVPFKRSVLTEPIMCSVYRKENGSGSFFILDNDSYQEHHDCLSSCFKGIYRATLTQKITISLDNRG